MGAQTLAFGEKLPGSGGNFIRLKQKGDKVQMKIAQEPVFVGKHFIEQEGGKWNVPECPRVMEGEDCEICNQYFEIMNEVKRLKAQDSSLKDDSPEIKPLKEKARPFQTTIEFYFPILDRIDGKFKILQTTNGVRNKFNAQFEAGVDVMTKEWILANTGGIGVNKYMLSPVDSADVKDMTEEEQIELEKARKYDLSSISQGSKVEEDFPDKDK